MHNVCYQCGEYRVDKIIEPEGPYAVCPACGYRHAFKMLPLLVVSGASGCGKSTVLQHLIGQVDGAVLLESDIIWMEAFNTPEDGYRLLFETWLRIAKNIGQSGRPVVIFGAGVGVPANLESCLERRYFSIIHYLALVCEDEEIALRLRARPQWRESGNENFIAEHIRFNRWFKEEASQGIPAVELLDNTRLRVDITAEQVRRWILRFVSN